MNELLAGCLRHLRERLCWRKWTRTCYGQAPTKAVEIRWLKINDHTDQLLQHPLVRNYFALDLALPRIIERERTTGGNYSTNAILAKHYELYLSWPDEKRFIVWYMESLRRLLGIEYNNQEVDTYRTTYFRLNYTFDFSTQAIDDSSLWYFVRCTVEEDERSNQILRIVTMLNESPLQQSQSIQKFSILDDMRLSFDILRTTNGKDLPIGVTECQRDSDRRRLSMSMVDVVDKFEWYVGWKDEGTSPLYTRLAPTANAVQLTMKKRQRKNNEDISGLEFERKRPIFEESPSKNKTRCFVYATNVILDSSSLDESRVGHSFYLLHEKQGDMVSIFIRPDQDPSIPYVFDLFNQSKCETASAKCSLRWVIANIGREITLTRPLLILLLRDIDNLLNRANFRVDNFLSREETKNYAVSSLATNYTSEIIEDKEALWRTLQKEKIVLIGKAIETYYAPTDNHLFQQENHKFIPWSLNGPTLMHWKAYSANPVESIDTFRTNQVARLTQLSNEQMYSLTNRIEIEAYLSNLTVSTVNVPIERVLPQPPVGLIQVVSKRVFALENGLVFVTTYPLKFLEKLTILTDFDRLRMFDDDNTDHCVRTRNLPRKRFTCFLRSEIKGSEIWFPLKQVKRERCYRGVNARIAPLIDWLDEVCSGDGHR